MTYVDLIVLTSGAAFLLGVASIYLAVAHARFVRRTYGRD